MLHSYLSTCFLLKIHESLSFVRCYPPNFLVVFLEGNFGHVHFFHAGNIRHSHSSFAINSEFLHIRSFDFFQFDISCYSALSHLLHGFLDETLQILNRVRSDKKICRILWSTKIPYISQMPMNDVDT